MNRTASSPKEKKLGRYLGISYITAGACFLFDPYIGIIDLLPDCLGYFFILLGLFRLADMDERLTEAMKGARNLAFVGLARVVAMLLSFGFVSALEQPVFMLLMLFVLAVLDCILLVPMWKQFCGGLLYLGNRVDATVMFDRRYLGGKQGVRNMVERYTAITTVFFIIREALAVLPEFTVLNHEKGGAAPGNTTHYYDFVGLFRGMGILLSLLLGIIWLILTIRFIHRLKKDKPCFERLTVKYRTEVLTRHDMWAMRAVRFSMGCLILATVFSLDFYVDGINILPDFLAAALLLLSVIFISPYAGKNIAARLSAVCFFLSATVTWGLQMNQYFRITDFVDIYRSDKLTAHWKTMLGLQALTSLLFILTVALILRTLFRMVKRYTGVRTFRDDSSYAADRSESIHKLIRKKLIWVMVCAILVGLSTLFYWGVVPSMSEEDILTFLGLNGVRVTNVFYTLVITGYRIIAEAYWFVDLCFGAALIGTVVSASGEISEQMEYSYMMKD